MAIPKNDGEKMQQLAREGKQISKIASEDFPNLEYLDVYFEVYNAGQRSSRGIKRMITTRLNKMAECRVHSQRGAMVKELNDLVWHLYENHKSNTKKLSDIRKALEK